MLYMKFTSQDVEDYVVALTRGFPKTDNFLQRFRIKPNAALLANLHYRCADYTPEMHQKKIYMH